MYLINNTIQIDLYAGAGFSDFSPNFIFGFGLSKLFLPNPMNQATQHIMMVRPKHFGYDPETAKSNAFQNKEGADHTDEINMQAISEFDLAVQKIEK